MGQTILDTSAIIKYVGNVLPPKGCNLIEDAIQQKSVISFVTEIELQAWTPILLEDIVNLNKTLLFLRYTQILYINQKIIDKTILIRKTYKLKLPDALIAATAMTNDFILIADNDKDFKRIPDLKYINPMKL